MASLDTHSSFKASLGLFLFVELVLIRIFDGFAAFDKLQGVGLLSSQLNIRLGCSSNVVLDVLSEGGVE